MHHTATSRSAGDGPLQYIQGVVRGGRRSSRDPAAFRCAPAQAGVRSSVFSSGAHKGRKGWRGIGLRTDDPDVGSSTRVDGQSGTTARKDAQDAYNAANGAGEGLRGRRSSTDRLLPESRIDKQDSAKPSDNGRPSRPKFDMSETNQPREGAISEIGLPRSTSSTPGSDEGWFGPAKTPAQEPREVADLLADLPTWLATQLAHCRANPERLLNRTASAIATELYGSPSRWRECCCRSWRRTSEARTANHAGLSLAI